MNTFLQRLGQIALTAGSYAAGVGPLAKTIFPEQAGKIDRGLDIFVTGVDIIVGVEAIGQTLSLPGTDKLRAATPLVADLLVRHPFLQGKKVKDPELFKRGAAQIAGGLADLLNSLDENKGVDVQDLAA